MHSQLSKEEEDSMTGATMRGNFTARNQRYGRISILTIVQRRTGKKFGPEQKKVRPAVRVEPEENANLRENQQKPKKVRKAVRLGLTLEHS